MSNYDKYMLDASRFDQEAAKLSSFAADMRNKGQSSLAKEYQERADDQSRLARQARDLAVGR